MNRVEYFWLKCNHATVWMQSLFIWSKSYCFQQTYRWLWKQAIVTLY